MGIRTGRSGNLGQSKWEHRVYEIPARFIQGETININFYHSQSLSTLSTVWRTGFFCLLISLTAEIPSNPIIFISRCPAGPSHLDVGISSLIKVAIWPSRRSLDWDSVVFARHTKVIPQLPDIGSQGHALCFQSLEAFLVWIRRWRCRWANIGRVMIPVPRR